MKFSKSKYIPTHYWEKGRRGTNQDSLALWQLRKDGREQIFAIVCDGIGGLPEGENASGYVVRQMVAWFISRGCIIRKGKHKKCALQQILFQIHEELREYGRKKSIQLGTTATFFWLTDGKYLWGHVGDSRLYHIRKGEIYQVTQDHCLPSGVLCRAVGAGNWQPVTLGEGRLRFSEALLLCTDGFYRGSTMAEWRNTVTDRMQEEEKVRRRLRQWGNRKLEQGETDNLSAVYCSRIRTKETKGELR